MACGCDQCVLTGSDCGCGPKLGVGNYAEGSACANGACAVTTQTRAGAGFGNATNNWAQRLRGNRPRGNWGTSIIAGVSNNDPMMNGAGQLGGNMVPFPILQPAEQSVPIPSSPAPSLLPSAQVGARIPANSPAVPAPFEIPAGAAVINTNLIAASQQSPDVMRLRPVELTSPVANIFAADFAGSNTLARYGSSGQAAPGSTNPNPQITPVGGAADPKGLTPAEDAARDARVREALVGMGTQGIGAVQDVLNTFLTQTNETERARERARTERILGQLQSEGRVTPDQNAQVQQLLLALLARQQTPPPPPPQTGITPTQVAIGGLLVVGVGLAAYAVVRSMKKPSGEPEARPHELGSGAPYGRSPYHSPARGKHPGYSF